MIIVLGWFCWLVGLFFSLKRKWIPFLFPIFLIATPANIDHVFPSVQLGDETSEAVVRIFTSTDLYLAIMTLRYGWKVPDNWYKIIIGIVIAIISILMINLIVHILFFDSGISNGLAMWGSTLKYFRFGICLAIIHSILINDLDFNKMIIGIYITMWILVVNSLYYTFIYSPETAEYLTAGSFGNNTFGSFLAVCVIFLLFSFRYFERLKIIKKTIMVTTIVLGIAFIFLTYVRMAVIALMVGFAILIFKNIKYIGFKKMSIYLIFLVPIMVSFSIFISDQVVDSAGRDKYNVEAIANSIKDGEENVTTSSLLSRILVWNSTLDMIIDHPIFGIGPGNFNRIRYKYGISWDTFLGEAHNNYLTIMVENGVPVFILFYLIIILGLIRGRKLMHGIISKGQHWLKEAAIISITIILFTDLTNSNLNKSQILLFVSLMLGVLTHPLKNINNIERT